MSLGVFGRVAPHQATIAGKSSPCPGGAQTERQGAPLLWLHALCESDGGGVMRGQVRFNNRATI